MCSTCVAVTSGRLISVAGLVSLTCLNSVTFRFLDPKSLV